MARPHKRRKGGQTGAQAEVVIDSLGAQGDGLADHNGKRLYVPLILPGEHVRVKIGEKRGDGFAAKLVDILEPSAERIEPFCPHYGECGGCTLQHFDGAAYEAWESEQVAVALDRAGIGRDLLQPLVRVADGTRRRTVLAVKGRGKDFRLGFHGRRSHTVADVRACAHLTPALNGLLDPLRAMFRHWPGLSRITVIDCDNGIDLLVEGEASPDLEQRETLVAFAETHDFARLSWVSGRAEDRFVEPVAMRRVPTIAFNGVPVTPPPGGFLQPSREGEAAIASRVVAAVGDLAPVADLYCGIGSFTFPLADGREVTAAEGLNTLTGALKAAADKAQVRNIAVETRDLTQQPLMPAELKRFKAVVFDPPRAGAKEQAEQLAEAAQAGLGPEVVVAVSCNPATFARDARILIDGGYACRSVTPIDQFPYSGHLEVVAVFTR